MNKRILAAMLWFYTGWYAGVMLADILGVSSALGPILGAAAAGLIVVDPRRAIWTSRSGSSAATKTSPKSALTT